LASAHKQIAHSAAVAEAGPAAVAVGDAPPLLVLHFLLAGDDMVGGGRRKVEL
jgi:hypothetical protein